MALNGWESVFFWLFSVTALLTGLLTVMARNTVHCALFLISSLISIGALYVLLGAEFVAGAQILVYVGAVMVLYIFVIMLVNIGKEESGKTASFNSKRQVAAAFVFSMLLIFAFVVAINRGVMGLRERDKAVLEKAEQQRILDEQYLRTGGTGTMKISRNTEIVGGSLYRFASLPFEIASVLLLVAIVGSVMLARTKKQEEEHDAGE